MRITPNHALAVYAGFALAVVQSPCPVIARGVVRHFVLAYGHATAVVIDLDSVDPCGEWVYLRERKMAGLL
jgi:hypothetical protein